MVSDGYIPGLGPNQGTMLTSTAAAPSGAAAGGSNAFGTIAPFMMAMGAVQSAVGAYYGAQTAKYQMQMQGLQQSFQLGMQGINAESSAANLEFNATMADINARQMENQAQWTMLAGQRQIGQLTLRAGKIKSAQRASQAARGVVLGYGSTAEEVATTDLVKEMDAITINVNATRAAESYRTQKVNFENQALLARVSARSARAAGEYYTGSAGVAANYYSSMSDAVNPWMSVTTSLTGSGASMLQTMYRDQKFSDYLAAISQSRT